MSEIKRVRLVIVQPPVRTAPSEWDTTVEELEYFRKHVNEQGFHAMQVATIEKPEAFIHHQHPGESQCQWCKVKADCRKYAEMVGDAAFLGFENLIDPEAKTIMPTDTNLLSGYFLRLKMIRDWCDAVEEKATALAKDGTLTAEKHGLKFVRETRGVRRAWADEAAAEEVLTKALNKSEAYKLKLISPTDAEKLLADRPRTWKKVEPLITKGEGSLKLVHISDKREAVSIAPSATGFDDVTETPQAAPADIDNLI